MKGHASWHSPSPRQAGVRSRTLRRPYTTYLPLHHHIIYLLCCVVDDRRALRLPGAHIPSLFCNECRRGPSRRCLAIGTYVWPVPLRHVRRAWSCLLCCQGRRQQVKAPCPPPPLCGWAGRAPSQAACDFLHIAHSSVHALPAPWHVALLPISMPHAAWMRV